MPVTIDRAREPAFALALLAAAALAFAACSEGSGGGDEEPPPAEPPPTPTEVGRDAQAPGIVATIESIAGGSLAGGAFRPGDEVTLVFALAQRDGSPWGLAEMAVARALVSGPTFSYQRVIAAQDDVRARAVHLGGGRYRYTFADAIPGAYLAPLNDSPAFGAADGERAGQDLLDGTYTAGLAFAWDYTVEGAPFRDAGEAVGNFLVGDSATLAAREVVRQDNCVRCHVELRAHDDVHRDVRVCVLCHTSGAEDLNDPAIEGGTPGVSVDSRVLFHKIHNGRHLPSVVGVAVGAPSGALTWEATPRRYRVVGGDGTVNDYSDVGFPVFPGRAVPMPRDFGHDALPPAARARDDLVRTGVTHCRSCHGDPDGDGPLVAPAQGAIITTQPSRAACGACHDDVDWGQNYFVNQQVMPPQPDSGQCNVCHNALGGALAVIDGHRHPLLDTIFEPHAPFESAFNPGLELTLSSAVEAGDADGDGTFDRGERVRVTFDLADDAGEAVEARALSGLRAVVAGPTSSSSLVLDAEIPLAALAGAPPYATNLPERRLLELVGVSTAGTDAFTTQIAPHWDVAGAETVVRVRAATGPATALAAPAAALQNFVDVADASSFARDDFVVVGDGAGDAEEYVRVQYVEGQRLWLSSPRTPAYPSALRRDHAGGEAVARVVLEEKSPGVDWSLDAATGTIEELVEFGAGRAVLVDSTSDFVWPARYPLAHNGSPDLDETSGEWTGKPLVSGTYRVGLTGWIDRTLFGAGVQDDYRIASAPAVVDVRFGAASEIEPYASIASGASCDACHQDLYFHAEVERGVARGFDACILCHANSGMEDVPRYVAAGAPETSGVTTTFRTLLHQIHRGAGLAEELVVAAAGAAAYPQNFSAKSYATFEFPANPGGVAQCARCHGAANEAWRLPPPRDHPSAQGAPVLAWRAVCGACHDSPAAGAHIALETSAAGVEACEVCHEPGSELGVERVHRTR